MHRVGGLFEQVCSLETMRCAFVQACRGKHQKDNVKAFQGQIETRLPELCRALSDGSFEFGRYHRFTIYDPKERVICAARFEERIVHHAMMLVCGGTLERALVDSSCACRKGKGQYVALEMAQRDMRRHPWCLKLDMSRYFDSIDHGIVMAQLRRKFREERLLELFERLLASYETAPGKGLPIGNLTSQYLANLYLDPFDRYAGASKARGYVRYMDDVLVTGAYDDLKTLHRACGAFLDGHLKLSLKHGGSLHRCDRGMDFLGYRLFPDHLLLNRRSKMRFERKLAEYRQNYKNGHWDELRMQEKCTALFAFVEHADTWNLRKAVLSQNGG